MIGETLCLMPAWRLRELVAAKALSPVEITRHFLDRIEQLDPALNAYLAVAGEDALSQARAAERAVLDGGPLGPLHGVPVSIKDMFRVRGMPTTAGSLLFRDFMAPDDSVHAERLREAGAVILGKTNTPEFGLAGRTRNRLGEECLNPWDVTRTPGGSSGGAAAAVAAGMGPLAVGSDGGGSIRIPAAFCGVFGLHPSNGRVPRHGGLGGTLLMSGVGPLARCVRDAALLLQVLAGPDTRDPTCRRDAPPDYLAELEAGVQDLRVAWTPDYGYVTGAERSVVEAVRKTAWRLEEAGARVDAPGLKLEDTREAKAAMSGSDNYALLGREVYEDPDRRRLLTPYARRRYARGRKVTGADYTIALRTLFRFIAELDRWFERYDLIASPTVGFTAPRLADLPPFDMPPDLAAYTEMVNFAGFTAASLPCGLADGMPSGLHLIARPNDEALLLRTCRAIEKIQPWPQCPMAEN